MMAQIEDLCFFNYRIPKKKEKVCLRLNLLVMIPFQRMSIQKSLFTCAWKGNTALLTFGRKRVTEVCSGQWLAWELSVKGRKSIFQRSCKTRTFWNEISRNFSKKESGKIVPMIIQLEPTQLQPKNQDQWMR